MPFPQVDLEERDPHGCTPLRLAVKLGHRECVDVLLEFGASCSDPDAQGRAAG
jgi:ankyrin repeat protein